jgi:hypothetical protein
MGAHFQNIMNNSHDRFARLSQAIVDAIKPENEEQARKNQTAAALVVNSVGSMVTEKPAGRVTQFDAAVNLVGDAIKTAKARNQTASAAQKSEKAEQPKSLAELLTEAQDSAE